MAKKRKFPEESMFINCLYTFADYTNKIPDSVIVVHKDKDGNKGFTYIEEPSYTYYVTKDIDKQYSEYEGGYEYRYISLKDVTPVTTKYSKRYKSMVDHTTNIEAKKFYKNCINSNNTKELQNLHLFKEFHSSDVNITDYFIDEFCEENNQTDYFYDLNISAFDIEVKGDDYVGFPSEDIAPCPVNAISYFNFKENTLTVFLQYYEETYDDFVENYLALKKEEIKKIYSPHFGDFKINVKVRNNELLLIKDFFDLVNKDKPDYCLAWNARFDIFTLYNRLKQLLANYDNLFPEDIMCPSEFPIKKVILRKDESIDAKKDFTKRTDVYNIYGYTIWLDMMVLYGNITRPQGKKESYALNDIGLEETSLSKESLSEEGTNIKTVYKDNFPLFFKYSCIDTMLLSLIINNTGFVDLLHTIVVLTRTRANKALTKTVCLRNYVNVFYRKNGYVISNNRSSIHVYDKNSIKGAYVAPPELMDSIGSINGIPTNKILMFLIDMDLSSQYPNNIRSHNISSTTAELRIIVSRKLKGIENSVRDNDNTTKEFMEKYLSEDSVRFCYDYHNVPSYDEMYNIFKNIKKEMKEIK